MSLLSGVKDALPQEISSVAIGLRMIWNVNLATAGRRTSCEYANDLRHRR